mmetsp:Transcript_8951/g.15415  ORF Transcript_8951/g.15415 Transcript_8951/m.15415 type:complete len:228 (+) Transcript_8951:249-932(+)
MCVVEGAECKALRNMSRNSVRRSTSSCAREAHELLEHDPMEVVGQERVKPYSTAFEPAVDLESSKRLLSFAIDSACANEERNVLGSVRREHVKLDSMHSVSAIALGEQLDDASNGLTILDAIEEINFGAGGGTGESDCLTVSDAIDDMNSGTGSACVSLERKSCSSCHISTIICNIFTGTVTFAMLSALSCSSSSSCSPASETSVDISESGVKLSCRFTKDLFSSSS